jgi:ABC-type transport system involved in cytochrome c biogenesis permease subunit
LFSQRSAAEFVAIPMPDARRIQSQIAGFPNPRILDDHQLVLFGFLFLSVGIITGAVWAHSAWGRYWGWDPKETWSLITWFVYATLLHARMMRGWRGKRTPFFPCSDLRRCCLPISG